VGTSRQRSVKDASVKDCVPRPVRSRSRTPHGTGASTQVRSPDLGAGRSAGSQHPRKRHMPLDYACHAGLMGHAGLHIQLGDVATWVGGIGTAAALLLTWRLLRITRQEQRATQAEQRQAQARLVSAWCDHVAPSGNGFHVVTVKLQNSSDEPIYGMIASVGVSWIGVAIRHAETNIVYVLPPKSSQKQDVSLQLSHALDGSYETPPPVEVIFYDATHRALWLRDRFGQLVQITDNGSGPVADHFFRRSASFS